MSPPKDPVKYEEWRQKKSNSLKIAHQRSHFGFDKGVSPWNAGLKGVQVSHNKGKTMPKEVRDKVSQSRKGKYVGEENHKFKREIERVCLYCGTRFFVKPGHGRNRKFCTQHCSTIYNGPAIGEILSQREPCEHPNWKGGITPLNDVIRHSEKYSEWRGFVLQRDDYCDWFSGIRGGDLEVHHIIPFHKLLKKYKIKSFIDALNCEPLWDTNNGITLSKSNHAAYHDMWGLGDLE